MLDTANRNDYIAPQNGYGSAGFDPKPCGCYRWHVAATFAQSEHTAYAELLAQGYVAYLPLHLDRHNCRIVPLWRGYVLVAFDAATDAWGSVRRTRGVRDLLTTAPGRPAPLPVGCVEDLIARTSERRIVDDPGVTVTLAPTMPVGRLGRVLDGPLAGWQGVCTMSTERRVRLLLAVLGGSREVEFSQKSVTEV